MKSIELAEANWEEQGYMKEIEKMPPGACELVKSISITSYLDGYLAALSIIKGTVEEAK